MSFDDEFLKQRQAAIERMNEMSALSKMPESAHIMPPTPSFVRVQNKQSKKHPLPEGEENQKESIPLKPQNTREQKKANKQNNNNNNGILGTLGLPFNLLKSDKDVTLILGLLLLLINEKADKKLLLALLYILF